MAEYDGLPLNTPTVIADTVDYTKTATRTANGGTVTTTSKPGSVGANTADIDAKLAQLYTDAATAQTNIANLLATAAPGAGTLTTAQLSNVVRTLDTALRQVANIESNVIARMVAIVKRIRGDLGDTIGT